MATYTGGSGTDTFAGTDDPDTASGLGGSDVLSGAGGNDFLSGGEGDDELNGGGGNDQLFDISGFDILDGGDGDDNVFDEGGGFDLSLGDGNDVARLKGLITSTSSVDGGLGNDDIYFDDVVSTPGASVEGGGGNDRLIFFASEAGGTIDLSTFAMSGIEDVSIHGGGGNDHLTASSMGGYISGNGGNDVIFGGSGEDIISGGAGVDELHGGVGNDSLNDTGGVMFGDDGDDEFGFSRPDNTPFATLSADGGIGRDTFTYFIDERPPTSAIGAIDGGADNDELNVSISYNLVAVNEIHFDAGLFFANLSISSVEKFRIYAGLFPSDPAVRFYITGSDRAESISGEFAADVLDGGAGSDEVNGFEGNDVIFGGLGADVLNGGSGADRFTYRSASESTAAARDTITDFSTGQDIVDLTALRVGRIDIAGTGQRQVSIETSDGVISLLVTTAIQLSDFLVAGHYVVGTTGVDGLTGTTFGDLLDGREGNDSLNGLAGNDTLNGGAGVDTADGGTGDDFIFVDNAGDIVVEAAGGGNDRVFASVSYTLGVGQSVETLSTTNNGGAGAINLTGNELAQTILGNAGANLLDGKAGADTLIGFGGNDFYYVDNVADRVIEGASEGVADRIFASASYILGAGVYVETLSTDFAPGTAAINLTGNELINTIFGNAGANSLDGKAGADTMAGFGGNDFYYVDNAADRVVEGAGEGTADRIFASVSYVLGAGVQVETLSTSNNAGTNAINLTGNELANSVLGNAGANILDGKAGADTLAGFGGNDFYYVDTAADRVVEGAGEGTADRVFASASYALAAGVQVETLSTSNNAGTNAIDLTGNELANSVFGNAGANILDGKAGADTLAGFGGADQFRFSSALGAGNVDRILDFVSGSDRILLDKAVFAALGGPGALNANAFATGTAAADASDRIIYDGATGRLFYDADGNLGGAAILFATLDGRPALAAGDFTVI